MSSPSQPIENIFLPADDLSLLADALPGPPPELDIEISRAAAAESQLRARGESVRFDSPMDGPLEIELRRRDGSLIRSLSAAEAIGLACGDDR
jgi:hypothetical protein